MCSAGPRSCRAASCLLALLAVLVVAFGGPRAVLAHTDLDFTLPADGASVAEPVTEISIGFTQPVTLIGSGFEVLDPQGTVRTPLAVSDDDQVFRLQLDPPLVGGEAAVRYEVRAQDGHTISGGYSFTVTVEAAVATTVAGPPSETSATVIDPEPTDPTTIPPPASTAGPDPTSERVPDERVPDERVPDDAAVAEPIDDDDDSSGVYLALTAAVVLGAAAFLYIRSRAMAAGRP